MCKIYEDKPKAIFINCRKNGLFNFDVTQDYIEHRLKSLKLNLNFLEGLKPTRYYIVVTNFYTFARYFPNTTPQARLDSFKLFRTDFYSRLLFFYVQDINFQSFRLRDGEDF